MTLQKMIKLPAIVALTLSSLPALSSVGAAIKPLKGLSHLLNQELATHVNIPIEVPEEKRNPLKELSAFLITRVIARTEPLVVQSSDQEGAVEQLVQLEVDRNQVSAYVEEILRSNLCAGTYCYLAFNMWPDEASNYVDGLYEDLIELQNHPVFTTPDEELSETYGVTFYSYYGFTREQVEKSILNLGS